MAKRKKVTQVPLDGGEAFAAGFMAADCPYTESDNGIAWAQWNDQFDAAADAALEVISEEEINGEVEEAEKEDRSVVKGKFRARYSEAGHPAHCGDELAVLLNNLCLTKSGIDMPRFEHIMKANGVDLSKYNRTTKGWEGRLRMTGRNILAGKAFAAGGVVKTTIELGANDEPRLDDEGRLLPPWIPLEGAEPEYRLSADWMASRRKVKAE